MVSVECGGCHARYLIKPEHAGKTIRCPKCGHGVKVPGGQAEVLSEITPVNPTDERASGARSSKQKLLIALGGLVGVTLGVAVGVVAILLFTRSGPTPGEPPKTAVQSPDSRSQPPPTTSQGKPNENAKTKVETPPAKKPAPMDPGDGGPMPKPPALADLIEKLDDGVVLITAFDESGDRVAEGSGFVLDASGLIATNYHVLDDAHSATVQMRDGTKIDVGGVRACDSEGDLLIIELAEKPAKLEVLPLAPDAPLRQGAEVLALGHPSGFRFTVSNGIISAVRKTVELPDEVANDLDARDDYLWVQTTAAISGGNSGGPLLNRFGQVIGINTWIARGENLAFAAHVRHLADLHKRIEPKAEPLAEFLPRQRKIDEKLAMKRFTGRLQRACREALALKWNIDSAGDYRKISDMATGLWYAAQREVEREQIDGVRSSLKDVKWSYQTHIQPINDMAAATIDTFGVGVVFLGTITTVHADRDKFVVRLTGRGYDLWVEDLAGPGSWKVGESCLVMGARASLGRDPEAALRQIHQIQAAIVEPVKLEDVPADTALRVLRDFIQYRRQGRGFVETLQRYAPNFDELAYDPKDQQVAWYKYTLNKAGHGFDALRLKTPAGARRDFVWHVAGPERGMASWYILPLKGSMSGFRNFFKLPNYTETGLDLPERNFSFLQSLSGRNFKPASEYVLWFTFVTDKPVDVYVRARLAPLGSVQNTGRGLRTALDAKRVPGPARVASADGPTERPMAKAKIKRPLPKQPPVPMPNRPEPPAPGLLTPVVAKKNREAAQQTLQSPGVVFVQLPGSDQPKLVKPKAELPRQSFFLVEVRLLRQARPKDLSYLAGLTQLKRLDVARDAIADDVVATLKDVPALSDLSLSGDGITDATASHIKRFETLTRLTLRYAKGVTDRGVAELKELKQLTSLDLSDTGVSDGCAATLASFPRLEEIKLSRTRLTDEGARDLVKSKSLKSLRLLGTQITDVCLKDLVGSPTITSLEIGSTRITEQGLAALAEAKNLRELGLTGTSIGETGLKHLSRMRSLSRLVLFRCGVTTEQAAALQKAMPKCLILGVRGYKPLGR